LICNSTLSLCLVENNTLDYIRAGKKPEQARGNGRLKAQGLDYLVDEISNLLLSSKIQSLPNLQATTICCLQFVSNSQTTLIHPAPNNTLARYVGESRAAQACAP